MHRWRHDKLWSLSGIDPINILTRTPPSLRLYNPGFIGDRLVQPHNNTHSITCLLPAHNVLLSPLRYPRRVRSSGICYLGDQYLTIHQHAGVSYGQIAAQLGKPEQHVIDSMFEFSAIRSFLTGAVMIFV